MGRSRRQRPARLGDKLIRIRRELGLSQQKMLDRLEDTRGLTQTSISGYEHGVREPPLSAVELLPIGECTFGSASRR